MEPFSIQCTTCRRSLRVVSAEAIGQILSCPKCGSMVLIEPPSAPAASISEKGPPVQPASPSGPALAPAPPPTVVAAPTPVPISVTPPAAAAVDEIPIALPVTDEPVVAARWPWWFWPGVAATATLSLAIIAVRLLFFSGGDVTPALAAVATTEGTRHQAGDFPSTEPAPASDSAEAAVSGAPAVVEPTANDQPPVAIESTPAGESETPADAVVADPPAAESPATDVPPEPAPPAAAVVGEGAGANDEFAAASEAGPAHTTMLRVPPRPVDVDSRLGDAIPAIDARDVPLWAMLELISQMSTIPISLDVDSLVSRSQSAAMPVTARLGSGPAADVLEAVLEPYDLVYQVRDGQLIVGHVAPEETRRVRYTVSDLVGSDERASNELAALVRRMVMPGSWQEGGGRGSLGADSGTLVVEQSDQAHLDILMLCERLRTARGKPTKSRYDPATFRLVSRHAKAEKLLTRPVTANFATPQSLQAVIGWLRQATGATILIDHAALARSGMSQESHAAVVASSKPLEQLLDDLLSPIDLTWRAVDDRTIEITTPQAAARRMEVEFYGVRDLASDGDTGRALADKLRREVDPQSWGEQPTQAAVQYDVPSRTLLVRAPYGLQTQAEHWLAKLRAQQ